MKCVLPAHGYSGYTLLSLPFSPLLPLCLSLCVSLRRTCPMPVSPLLAEGCLRPQAKAMQGKARSCAQINPTAAPLSASACNDYTPLASGGHFYRATIAQTSYVCGCTGRESRLSLYKSKLCNLFTFCIKIVH